MIARMMACEEQKKSIERVTEVDYNELMQTVISVDVEAAKKENNLEYVKSVAVLIKIRDLCRTYLINNICSSEYMDELIAIGKALTCGNTRHHNLRELLNIILNENSSSDDVNKALVEYLRKTDTVLYNNVLKSTEGKLRIYIRPKTLCILDGTVLRGVNAPLVIYTLYNYIPGNCDIEKASEISSGAREWITKEYVVERIGSLVDIIHDRLEHDKDINKYAYNLATRAYISLNNIISNFKCGKEVSKDEIMEAIAVFMNILEEQIACCMYKLDSRPDYALHHYRHGIYISYYLWLMFCIYV